MVFANLTVRENLRWAPTCAATARRSRRERDYVFALFPRLRERDQQIGGHAVGRRAADARDRARADGRPRLLLLDEPSLGLAPLLVQQIFEQIVEINRDRGITILLVEQNANLALDRRPGLRARDGPRAHPAR